MSNINRLGKILRESREKQGLSLIGLRDKIRDELKFNIEPTSIHRLEKGITQRPDKEYLKAIAEILNLNIEELYRLADYYPELTEVKAEYREDMIEIPIARSSGGPGALTQEIFYLPKNRIKAGKVVGYEVVGYSMEPDIPDGSFVAVDLVNSAKAGDIVSAWVGDQNVIKRLIERKGQMYLLSNSGEPIPVDDSVRIEGPVVFVGKFL